MIRIKSCTTLPVSADQGFLSHGLAPTYAVLRRGKFVSSILHVPKEVRAQQTTDFRALRDTSILQVIILAKLSPQVRVNMTE